MDISVLLALDTAAFQQGLKAATDALGQFKAGADVCFEALGKAQAQIDAAADAAAKEAAKVTEAAEAAKAEAEAEREAAKAAKAAADAEEEHAEKAGSLGAELGKAKGAMGAASGAAAALSGDFQGVVRGTMQASQGMRALGASMQAVERASVVLAAVGAAVAAVATVFQTLRARAEEVDRIRLENLAAGAERAQDRFELLARAMERAAGLRRDLDDAAGAERRLDQDRQFAELERDRNRELAAGGDADEVNRRYDERKRKLEFSFQRADVGEKVAGIDRDRAANEERIAVLRRELANAQRTSGEYHAQAQEAYAKGNAGFFERIGRGDFRNQSNEAFVAKGDELDAKSAEWAGKATQIIEQIKSLENRNEALARDREVAQGSVSVIDIKEEAATLAAAIPKKEPEDAGRTGAGREGTGGGWGSMQTASDRLARIGGFVGGSNIQQNEARERIQSDKRREKYLEQIAENTKNKEQGGLA